MQILKFVFLVLVFFLNACGGKNNSKTEKENKDINILRIEGDFDAKGKGYASCQIYLKDGTKTNYEEVLEDESAVKPSYCQLEFSNPNIHPLRFDFMESCMGLSYLANLGDLNGDAADEIMLIANWHIGVNRAMRIYSYINGEWIVQLDSDTNIAVLSSFREIVRKGEEEKTIIVQEVDFLDGSIQEKIVKLK